MTKGVSPLELATAYGVLANQGIKTEPFAILKVTDSNGRLLEQHQIRQNVVLSEQTSYLMTDLLRGGVIERGERAKCEHWQAGRGQNGNSFRLSRRLVRGLYPRFGKCCLVRRRHSGTHGLSGCALRLLGCGHYLGGKVYARGPEKYTGQ